ncbi:MAG: hypothetical protein CO095_13305, partial [Armatimonadetes bacterium CG_4_9_14_3_um_filter_58_7]
MTSRYPRDTLTASMRFLRTILTGRGLTQIDGRFPGISDRNHSTKGQRMAILALLLAAVIFVAYTNGANENF